MNREEKRIADEIAGKLDRRHFLRTTSAAALAALAGTEPRLVAGSTKLPARDDSMILLWMERNGADRNVRPETLDALLQEFSVETMSF
jgi:hypothetical protein